MFSSLFLFLLQLLLLLLLIQSGSSNDCLNCEISIKSAQNYYSYGLYQKAMYAYSLNQTFYGISVKVDNVTFPNRSQWSNMMSSNQLNVDFSVLENEMTAEEKRANPDLLSVPVAMGALVYVYNLPGVTDLINMPVDTIVGIFLGVVTRWNDPLLQTLNPNVTLPNQTITVWAIGGDSMQTYYLSSCFAAYSKQWRNKFGRVPFSVWPSEFNYSFSFTSFSSINLINGAPYTFGYSSWNMLSGFNYNNVKYARIVTNDQVISALLSLFFNDETTEAVGIMPNLVQNKQPYPFVYFQYIALNSRNSTTGSCCAVQETVGFVDFFLDYNNDYTQGMFGYFPMPNALVKKVRSSILSLVTCKGVSAFDEFKKIETLEAKSKRQQLITIVVPALLCFVLVFALLSFAWYYKRIKMVNETFWIISCNEIRFDVQPEKEKFEKGRSSSSLRSVRSETFTASVSLSHFGKYHQSRKALWTRNETEVTITLIDAKSSNNWRRNTKALITNFCKNLTHPNLSVLYGVSNIEGKPYQVSQHCVKGTLNFVLSTCPYTLSKDIKYSLANDAIQGLTYLHRKGIVHGSLSSFSCDVDSLWTVKLTNWSKYSLMSSERIENSKIDTNQINDKADMVKLLFVDPAAWYPGFSTLATDVYSYGMLLVEIFTQKTPFYEEIELCSIGYLDLLKNKVRKVYDVPTMSVINVPNNVQQLVVSLLSVGSARPNSPAVAKQLHEIRGNTNKSVVDIMMQTLESYVMELEEKVIERTSELTQMTNRMKDLLNQLLPPQIASKFIKGESVEPEFFECATIFFSDIVGFTKISARSTPIQVMAFLNELWREFDKIVERFDVYKVDTIGDAYVVASGLPIRNGINHCKNIADLALSLLRLIDTFTIPHLKDEKLKVRMGINSGPVTAGVVGFKMPQYCIFGDTVNTASRMESTSLPFFIQVSESFYKLTTQYFNIYRFQYRGETEVKGKGKLETYWLLGTTDQR